jgi:hypothetical protein
MSLTRSKHLNLIDIRTRILIWAHDAMQWNAQRYFPFFVESLYTFLQIRMHGYDNVRRVMKYTSLFCL